MRKRVLSCVCIPYSIEWSYFSRIELNMFLLLWSSCKCTDSVRWPPCAFSKRCLFHRIQMHLAIGCTNCSVRITLAHEASANVWIFGNFSGLCTVHSFGRRTRHTRDRKKVHRTLSLTRTNAKSHRKRQHFVAHIHMPDISGCTGHHRCQNENNTMSNRERSASQKLFEYNSHKCCSRPSVHFVLLTNKNELCFCCACFFSPRSCSIFRYSTNAMATIEMWPLCSLVPGLVSFFLLVVVHSAAFLLWTFDYSFIA